MAGQSGVEGTIGRRAWLRSRRSGSFPLAVVLAALTFTGCGVRAPAPPAHGVPQTGMASWYGPGFHGHPTTSGEPYNQHDLTAAHPTLPLGTRVRVTNLDNGRSVEVRINDRGPFLKERAIDLSYAAAHAIGVVGPGTAPVRIETVERPPGGYARVFYCVQVGSFNEVEKARALHAELAPRYGDVYISAVRARADLFYRVRVGPYAERSDAERRAGEIASLGLPGVVAEEPQP